MKNRALLSPLYKGSLVVTASLSILTDSKESTEASVYDRYSAASRQVESALCCPVSYAGQYLKAVPQEIIEKDYGCGDPSAWVNEGDTVLDLGSGAGKLCYIMSQVVGPNGKIIGVDCNTEMLELSRKYRSEVAQTIGAHKNGRAKWPPARDRFGPWTSTSRTPEYSTATRF